MQRILDKWGLWVALVVVGSVIGYGLISGYMKAEDPGRIANQASLPAPAK